MSKAIYTATTTEGMYYRLPDDCLSEGGKMKDQAWPDIPEGVVFTVARYDSPDFRKGGEAILDLNDSSWMPRWRSKVTGFTRWIEWSSMRPVLVERSGVKKTHERQYYIVDKRIEAGDLVRCIDDDCQYRKGQVTRVVSVQDDILFRAQNPNEEEGQLNAYRCVNWEVVKKAPGRAVQRRVMADLLLEAMEQARENGVDVALRDSGRFVSAQSFSRREYGHPRGDDTHDPLISSIVALSRLLGKKPPEWC